MSLPAPKPEPLRLPQYLHRKLDCNQGTLRAVRFNVDGNYCLTCGSDKSIKIWNPHNGMLLKTYRGHGSEVLDAAGSFDNSQFCSCSVDKTVMLWDVARGLVVQKFRGHEGTVYTVQFNEQSSMILSGSLDSTIRCWDTRSRRSDAVQVLDDAIDGITSLKVSEHEILAGSVDGNMRCYDIRSGELCTDFVGDAITCVSFSQDFECLLASTVDSCLFLLDKDTGELLAEYSGHDNSRYKLDCCFNETDSHVLSGSEDGTVCFWDVLEGSLTLKLPVSNGIVQSISYHPKEPCLLTASEGEVKLWRAEAPEDDGGNGS